MLVTGHLIKITTRKGNGYKIVVELPKRADGKRVRYYKNFYGTKKQAEHKLRELISEYENGTHIQENSITVEQWMNTWLDTYITEKSATTIAGYKKQIRAHIIPAFGTIPLQDLTPIMVQEWVNGLYNKSTATGKPMKAKTVKNVFFNLKAACDKAVNTGIISKNPCNNIELRYSEKQKIKPYTPDEVNKLIDASKGTELELFIKLDLILGLRRGEMLALKWGDIDFNNCYVHIQNNLVLDEDRKLVTKSPKSVSGVRDIALSPKQCAMLKSEHNKYLEKKLRQGSKFKDNDLVICKSNGMPYNPDTFSSKFRRFIAKNRLRKCRLHDLRHTNCTLLLMKGVPMKTMQERLGHSDYSTTANIYAHATAEADRKASEIADSLIS